MMYIVSIILLLVGIWVAEKFMGNSDYQIHDDTPIHHIDSNSDSNDDSDKFFERLCDFLGDDDFGDADD